MYTTGPGTCIFRVNYIIWFPLSSFHAPSLCLYSETQTCTDVLVSSHCGQERQTGPWSKQYSRTLLLRYTCTCDVSISFVCTKNIPTLKKGTELTLLFFWLKELKLLIVYYVLEIQQSPITKLLGQKPGGPEQLFEPKWFRLY